MDLRSQAEGVVAALATGRTEQYLAREVQGRLPPRGDYEVLEVLPRRNVAFVSWLCREGAAAGKTGTWVLSFDRAGRVIAWGEAA
jgi:hypothetical protein